MTAPSTRAPMGGVDGRTPARGVSAHAVLRAGDDEARRRAARRWPRRTPVLVLLVALAVTALATAFAVTTARGRRRARFDNAVQAAQDRIQSRIGTYVALLHGATGLFAASDTVTAADFQAYVTRLDLAGRYPGVRALGFSRRLTARESADGLWPAGTRAEYHAVRYLEPLDAQNRRVLGFDMHSEPSRAAAMDRARDTGQPAASGPVALLQQRPGAPPRGFLLYVPVYRHDAPVASVATVAQRREALLGFVFATFRADALFAGIFGHEVAPRVGFRVYDGVDTTAAGLLTDSRTLALTPVPAPRDDDVPFATLLAGPAPRTLQRFDVAGRPWTLLFTAEPEPEGTTRDVTVLAIALGGLFVSAVLFGLTRAEVRARERAERSESVRSRFFAAMSHELRTPINAILGYNDLLLAGIYGPLPEVQETGVRRSQRAARHLLELVNDVLDLSKLEAGKIDVAPEPVRLDELLDDLLTTIRPMAEERGCALELDRFDCARSLRTDPRRLRQILLNLLSNATKFGAGHPVRIQCALVPHGGMSPGRRRRRTAGDGIVITVTDGGPGIAHADQERIFEEFVQLPGASAGGTGLGLPISRRLAELLGGTLGVRSEPGRGSSFFVMLPLDGRRAARR